MRITTIHKQHTVSAISLLYIILFTYAGISKLVEFETFRVQLGQSPMLTSFSGLVAYGIPTLEIILAIALSINKLRVVALYASLGLMTAFTMYIIAILNFSDFVPCSCGGILEQLGWTEHLIFNIAFVLLAAIAIVLNDQIEHDNHQLQIDQLASKNYV
ncbi:hypothetical protein MQE36_12480 [Zhouia spongiae]|uniref:Methylamine utilisation protein MauE domain-containing protein n=1 Tax=Zhouia spongiae TaxID=2202721 RepID=A0ABY3YJM5_9FLAO|nr:MauE/DoxX family redox-associated membrane protein [Zhouia spongiae]UNY97898.1 hypothetical protein MQE36_12480 [Zhouia spongiae]